MVILPVVVGAPAAPPPRTMAFAARTGLGVMMLALEKYGMPPDIPVVIPVPPCATVTGAAVVNTVELAFGKVKVFAVEAGPAIRKNALPVPPFATGRMPATAVLWPRSTAPKLGAPPPPGTLSTWFAVPAAVALGEFPAPPPRTTPF